MRKSLLIVTLVLIVTAFASTAMADSASGGSAAGVVNINTADAKQLMLLPRVGEKTAQRVIEYRTQHGPFKKTADLMQVKGFGAKTFEQLSPYLAVDGKSTLAAKVASPRKPRAKKPAQTASN